MAKLVEKNGQLGIMITHVNEEGIKKRTILSLRKIAVAIGLTVGIGVLGINVGKSLVDNYQNKEAEKIEALDNLNENESFVEKQLETYSIALAEYNEVISKTNHSELDKIEKRVELISEIRNLQNTAEKLMDTKIAEGLGIEEENHAIKVERIFNGRDAGVTDTIKVTTNDKNEEVFFSDSIPNEFSTTLNAIDRISGFNGNGENEKWDNAIDEFIDYGNELQDAIIKLTTKNYTLEDNNLKAIESSKSM